MKQYDRKHSVILEAATRVFLRRGYLATSMDEIAKEAAVSKQTIYKHCASKEALFLDIIEDLTARSTELSQQTIPDPAKATDPQSFLEEYACRELETLLAPEVIRLRRLVIGEADRFPEVAKSYYENGPVVGFQILERILERFSSNGLIPIDDSRRAAEDLNWLILGHHLNRAMFLGDHRVPTGPEIEDHARRVVRLFLRGFATCESCR